MGPQRVDWKAFDEHLQNWYTAYNRDPDKSLDQTEKDLELRNTRRKGRDTAAGGDDFTYSMIQETGPGAQMALLNIINKSWEEGKLPSAWKKCLIQPIPKPKDPAQPRPISLISCLEKTAEKIIKALTSNRNTSPKIACVQGRSWSC
ncbi:hypothetical protein Pmani_013225 [Petrolisthes manimaculis]|uniref:Uncharacterized protein n=1 Tax=Petrolisthes manimaculis TaxID=1843537 RepID=A0AAE1PYX8_9EUCA|nr:hypothetical protein Pmani_013225 [Petrolisthes manimaculis]